MKPLTSLTVIVIAAVLGASLRAEAPPARPGLVVLIVIDQFPASLLERLEPRLAPAGFRLLMEQGAWYTNAHYPQAATLTGVGHATISTGALPAGHGIAGNDWYDRASDRNRYCVEDESHHWIGAKEKAGEGTSPRLLETTTFGDEWRLEAGPDARVLSISLKDRGSILLAGRLGKAFWYDERTGLFVSSTYYYPDGKLPAWAAEFNAGRPADRLLGSRWDLLLSPASYTAAPDDREYEIDVKGLGRTFPHVLGKGLGAPGPDLWKQVLTVPHGNQLILDMALAAIRGERLGRGGVMDMLLLSLTANDYCGHNFGPESLEYEDITLRTDRQIEGFMAAIEREVGAGRSLVVLTSDHGATPSPEYLTALGMPVGRIDPDHIGKAADDALDAAVGPADWAGKFLNPGLFLREPAVEKSGKRAEVERIAAEAVGRIPGVAATFTRGDIAAGRLPDTAIARSVAASFHAGRSPDVFIIQEPYWYLYKNVKEYEGMHGSPYAFDAHVPIILWGPGIRAGRHARRVSPADVAPTVCRLAGIGPPPSSEGSILEEALKSAGPGSGDLELWSFASLPPLLDENGRRVLMTVTAAYQGGSPPLSIPVLSPIEEGGLSGLARVRSPSGEGWEPFELWTITDRGPNMTIELRAAPGGGTYGPGAKYFPHPAYNQAILRLRLEPGRRLRILERIPLSRNGRPTNGLPSSAEGRRGSEKAYSSLTLPLAEAFVAPSERGHDFEGIHEDSAAGGSRRFWTCDEYGPSIQIFDAEGGLVAEFLPGVEPEARGGNGPALKRLPPVLRHRKYNRGFEGLAGTSRHIFAMVQSPLDPEGGASGETGHGNPTTRLHRIVRLDKETHESVMFGYDHVAAPEEHGTIHGEVKIGDIAVVDDSGRELLVYEHTGKLFTHVYRITIGDATTVLSEKEGVGYEAGRVSYMPVERRLVLDLTSRIQALPLPEKGEGLALLDERTVAVLFDNDCGFGTDDVEVFELPDIVKRSALITVPLEAR